MRLILSGLLAFAALGCSTYHQEYLQAPRPGAIQNLRADSTRFLDREIPVAVYQPGSDPTELVRIWVPLSGRHQGSVGPCLFPVIPYRKDEPQNLRVRVELIGYRDIAPIDPEGWTVRTRAHDYDEVDAAETVRSLEPTYIQKLAVPEDDLFSGEGGERREILELTYALYDNEFFAFALEGVRIRAGGQQIKLPAIPFERETSAHYTPFTTKFLDAL